jgi:DNA-binding CsgD family transcriptional regulator/PAS domain-containing protein
MAINVNGLEKLKLLEKISEDNAFTHQAIDLILQHHESKSSESLSEKLLRLIMDENHQQRLLIFQQISKEFIKMSNDLISIMDTQSQFVCVNHEYSKVVGFKHPDSAQGLSYEHFKGSVREFSQLFHTQDQFVLNHQQPLTYLSYHQYSKDQWRLLHGQKSIIHDNHQQAIGIYTRSADITQHKLIDISRFLLQEQKHYIGKIKQQSFTYYITQQDIKHQLSKKELETLFYFLRGKSAQDIALILHRSKRTIEMHLMSIKQKFNVSNKSELIEKAIFEGFMNHIPETILDKII